MTKTNWGKKVNKIRRQLKTVWFQTLCDHRLIMVWVIPAVIITIDVKCGIIHATTVDVNSFSQNRVPANKKNQRRQHFLSEFNGGTQTRGAPESMLNVRSVLFWDCVWNFGLFRVWLDSNGWFLSILGSYLGYKFSVEAFVYPMLSIDLNWISTLFYSYLFILAQTDISSIHWSQFKFKSNKKKHNFIMFVFACLVTGQHPWFVRAKNLTGSNLSIVQNTACLIRLIVIYSNWITI